MSIKLQILRLVSGAVPRQRFRVRLGSGPAHHASSRFDWRRSQHAKVWWTNEETTWGGMQSTLPGGTRCRYSRGRYSCTSRRPVSSRIRKSGCFGNADRDPRDASLVPGTHDDRRRACRRRRAPEESTTVQGAVNSSLFSRIPTSTITRCITPRFMPGSSAITNV